MIYVLSKISYALTGLSSIVDLSGIDRTARTIAASKRPAGKWSTKRRISPHLPVITRETAVKRSSLASISISRAIFISVIFFPFFFFFFFYPYPIISRYYLLVAILIVLWTIFTFLLHGLFRVQWLKYSSTPQVDSSFNVLSHILFICAIRDIFSKFNENFLPSRTQKLSR